MLIYFRSGRSAWFHEANSYEIETGDLILYGARKHEIARTALEVVEFYIYDNESVTTYGYPENADPIREAE
jgi:hypothetical protein